jgi:hypothetical protein
LNATPWVRAASLQPRADATAAERVVPRALARRTGMAKGGLNAFPLF